MLLGGPEEIEWLVDWIVVVVVWGDKWLIKRMHKSYVKDPHRYLCMYT